MQCVQCRQLFYQPSNDNYHSIVYTLFYSSNVGMFKKHTQKFNSNIDFYRMYLKSV